MGLFIPSEDELKIIGISRETYAGFDFPLAKLGGLYRWSKIFTLVYFSTVSLGFVTSCGFLYEAFRVGEIDAALEAIHFLPDLGNMVLQAASYHYHQAHFLYIIRVLDRYSCFDYKGTLDEESDRIIQQLKSQMRRRKQKFRVIFKGSLLGAFLGHASRKPLAYVMGGKWEKPIDGENNMIWNGIFGMFVPFSNYWPPYVFGILLSYATSCFNCLSAAAAMNMFQALSEELVTEYEAVAITFRRCVERAEILFADKQDSSEKLTFDECLRRCVNLSIGHHLQTLRLFEKYKKIQSFPLFILLVDGALILCLSAFLIISDDVSSEVKIPMAVGIASETAVAFTVCYYGEKLKTVMSKVGDGVYECTNWIGHSKTIKPYAMMVKSYCDVPNKLTGAGIVVVDHETFSNIISTAYSYMGLLLSTR